MIETKQNSWKKKATLFLVSQNISLFGSSVVAFAIIWHITLQTSSGKWMMMAALCGMIPQVVVSLWGGVWADRYNRKYLIMISDASIAFVTLLLAVAFFSGYKHLELLLLASVVRSAGAGVQTPAVNALLPQIVPTEKLTKVNGINQTLTSVLFLLSPAIGGVVLTVMDISWAFLLDVVTAAIALFILSFIKVRKVKRTGVLPSIMQDLKTGLSFAFNSKLLRALLICYLFSFFLITPASFLTPIMIERLFGNEVWRLSANEMAWTIGSLLGGAFVTLKGKFHNKIYAISFSLAAFGFTFALLGIAKTFTAYLIIMGAAGAFFPIMVTAQTVLIQEHVEVSMLGRMFSLVQIISGSAMPLAMLLFGPMADIVPIQTILIVTGIMLFFVGIIFSKTKEPKGKERANPAATVEK